MSENTEKSSAELRQVEKLQGEIFRTIAFEVTPPEGFTEFMHRTTLALAAVILERPEMEPVARKEAVYQFSEALFREIRSRSDDTKHSVEKICGFVDGAIKYYFDKLRQRP